MAISITEEMRRVAVSHERNGERLTADVLFRARDHIAALEAQLRSKQKRLDCIANLESGRGAVTEAVEQRLWSAASIGAVK